MLSLENISLKYADLVIFDQADMKIDRPGLYCITGKSGCGKTTLLNIIAGFEKGYSGNRYIDEKCKIGMIFQNFELISELDVKENVEVSNLSKSHSKEELDKITQRLKIDHILDHKVDEISYGQKQRVAIARTLLSDPNLILCDEPTESLNNENKEIVMDILKELSKEKIVIVVCHDNEIVKKYGDVVFHISQNKISRKNIHANELKSVVEDKIDLNYKNIFKTIFKINLYHKFNYFVTATLIFICVTIFSLYYNVKRYQIPLDKNILNYNTVYTDDTLFSYSRLNKNDNYYILPSVHNKITIGNKQYVTLANPNMDLLDNGIYISKGLADTLSENPNELIGKEITIEYTADNYTKIETCPIIKIVEESSSFSLNQFYYSYDYFQKLCDGDRGGGMIVIDQSNNVMNSYNYYHQLRSNFNNPYLEYIQFRQEQFKYVQVILFMLFGLFFVCGMIYLVYSIGIYERKQMKNIIILKSLDIPMNLLYLAYISIRGLMFMGCIIFSILLKNITVSPLARLLGLEYYIYSYDVLVYAIYAFIIGICIYRNVSKSRVNILKNN